MEKMDMSKLVADEAARLAAGGGQQPSMAGKQHVVYYIGGPLDLAKQAAGSDPGDLIEVPMFQPSQVTGADGKPLQQEMAVAQYKRVVWFMSPTTVFHVFTIGGVRPAGVTA
jgi:hypothetical protein